MLNIEKKFKPAPLEQAKFQIEGVEIGLVADRLSLEQEDVVTVSLKDLQVKATIGIDMDKGELGEFIDLLREFHKEMN